MELRLAPEPVVAELGAGHPSHLSRIVLGAHNRI